jgi:radical SAM superfamily enzyme YgiQ (UPF0313 family)
MKILLISPSTEKSIPLNLGYVGSFLSNFYDTKILNLGLYQNYKKFLHEIKKFDPDIVGISCVTPTFEEGLKIAKFCKELNPNVKIVFGGIHPSVMPLETLQNENVDFVIRGEGEYSMLSLVKNLERGKISSIRGVCGKYNGKLFVNERSPFIENLDAIPIPHTILELEKYKISKCPKEPPYNSAYVLSSRGCPFNCIYCSLPIIMGHKCRYHSIKRVIEELNYLRNEKGIRSIRFVDANFNIHKKRVIKLCKEMIKEKLDINWVCNAHVNFADKEVLTWMKRAGCVLINYGIESASQKILNNARKNIKIDQIIATLKLTKKIGIGCVGYFMFGLPGESKDTAMLTIQFAKSFEFKHVYFSLAIPFPGTKLYEWAKRNNYLISEKWSDYITNVPLIRTPLLGEQDLKNILTRAYLEFYFPRHLKKLFSQLRGVKDLIKMFSVPQKILKQNFLKNCI